MEIFILIVEIGIVALLVTAGIYILRYEFALRERDKIRYIERPGK